MSAVHVHSNSVRPDSQPRQWKDDRPVRQEPQPQSATAIMERLWAIIDGKEISA